MRTFNSRIPNQAKVTARSPVIALDVVMVFAMLVVTDCIKPNVQTCVHPVHSAVMSMQHRYPFSSTAAGSAARAQKQSDTIQTDGMKVVVEAGGGVHDKGEFSGWRRERESERKREGCCDWSRDDDNAHTHAQN